MRISDWSSDVCSSDLSPELGEPEDIASLCAFLAADESKFVNGQIISCDGGLMTHLPQVADHSEWEARHRKPPGRSEEHTSELQSLMRISYAVFCLKKKKLNTSRYNKVNNQ